MAGQKYLCSIDDRDCTLEIFRVCTKLCDFDDRTYATNHPGACGYRKSAIVERRNNRIV